MNVSPISNHDLSFSLEWVRPPQQGRAQRTLNRILDATEELLEHKTFDEISVHSIVQPAKSSVGAFYTRFSDKDALLQALHERYTLEATTTAARALQPANWDGQSARTILGAFVGFMVGHFDERRGLRRALVLKSVVDERVHARANALASHTTAHIAALLATRQEEISHPDPASASSFLHQMIFAVLDNCLLHGPKKISAPERARLQIELNRACCSYLGLPPEDDALPI